MNLKKNVNTNLGITIILVFAAIFTIVSFYIVGAYMDGYPFNELSGNIVDNSDNVIEDSDLDSNEALLSEQEALAIGNYLYEKAAKSYYGIYETEGFSESSGPQYVYYTMNDDSSFSIDENGGYRINLNSEKYRKLDAAIVNAFNAQDENEWSTARRALIEIAPEFRSYSQAEFKEAAYLADVFNENIARAVGENGAIERLDKLSHPLLNAYASVAYNEIAREIELAHIVKDRNSVRTLAHLKHNEMQGARQLALEMALHSIKAIAKKYYDEFGDISDELAYGTLDEQARNNLKEMLSPEDMRTYDDVMRIIALNNRSVTKSSDKNTSAINSLLPEIIPLITFIKEICWFEASNCSSIITIALILFFKSD